MKKHTAVSLGNRTRFGLRDARRCPGVRRLRYESGRAPNQSGDRRYPCSQTRRGGIQLDEFCRFPRKAKAEALFGLLQHDAGRRGLPHAGRAVQQDMLRIGPAQTEARRARKPLTLPDDFRKPRGPRPVPGGGSVREMLRSLWRRSISLRDSRSTATLLPCCEARSPKYNPITMAKNRLIKPITLVNISNPSFNPLHRRLLY